MSVNQSTVMARMESKPFVEDVSTCGPGVLVAQKPAFDKPLTFTELLDDTGYYVAAYDVQESGDKVTLMPLEDSE